MKIVQGVLFVFIVVFSTSVSAGALELLKTMKTAKGGYDTYQSGKTIAGLEDAKPIFSKVKRVFVVAETSPLKGSAASMNALIEKVVCDNVERIVDNLEKYDMEGATPKCKKGMPTKKSKKRIVIMKIGQSVNGNPTGLSAEYIDRTSGDSLKIVSAASADNYYLALVNIIDDLHNDFLISSRTNNPVTLKKWPKRFAKYSKKKKHREVSMKRKEKKQLEAGIAK
jgi:hypothetical protein